MNLPMTAPIFPAGKEPLPPGITEEERDAYFQAKKYERWMSVGMESCVAKTAIAGGRGASLLSAACCFGVRDGSSPTAKGVARFRHWGVLLAHELVVRVRGPDAPAVPEHAAEGACDL